VKDVSSVLDMTRSVWHAMREPGDTSELPADPTRAAGVIDFVELFAPRDLAEFATTDGQHTRINVRRSWADAEASEQLIDHVRAVLRHELGTDAKQAIVGPMVVMNRAVSSLLNDLVNSFSVGILTIGLVFIAFLRSLRMGLIAIIPNTLPVAMTVGLMGLLGFPLDVHTMLLASVVLGIVDDDTFHFMHHFRAHHAATGDTEKSLHWSYAQTARSLVVSSCTLALGFLTYLGASMHHIQRTAILLAFAVLSATVTEFIMTPALVRRFVRSRGGSAVDADDFKRDPAVAN
jgi:predicted RND superfamily exporter protein